jgi:hypothetical protein
MLKGSISAKNTLLLHGLLPEKVKPHVKRDYSASGFAKFQILSLT